MKVFLWWFDFNSFLHQLWWKFIRQHDFKIDRICRKCSRVCSPKHPDPCLGELPGVSVACCGHGDRSKAMISFSNGVIIRGFRVDEEWERLMDAYERRESAQPETVVVQIPMLVEPLLDGTEYDDVALHGLGEICVEMARDRLQWQSQERIA